MHTHTHMNMHTHTHTPGRTEIQQGDTPPLCQPHATNVDCTLHPPEERTHTQIGAQSLQMVAHTHSWLPQQQEKQWLHVHQATGPLPYLIHRHSKVTLLGTVNGHVQFHAC